MDFFFAGLVGEDEFPRVCIAKALSAFKKKKGEKIVVTGLSIKPRSSHSSFVGAASLFHSHLSFFVKSIRLAFSSFIFPPSLIPSNEYISFHYLCQKEEGKKKPH